MPSELRASGVVAIVASYRPDAELVSTAISLTEQFEHVVVVDDGSPAEFADRLDAIDATGVRVIRRPQNAGIAATLNAGIRAAEASWHPDFFVTFDQDSVPVDGYAERALATFREARAAGRRVGFVVASSYSGRAVRLRGDVAGFAVAFDPMQSGFVIARETIEAIGHLDEGLVIDGVDSEYTARARAAGFDVLVGAGCDIRHQLGRRDPARLFGRPLRLFGREISYNYHSPKRVYYIARNGTTLSRRYLLKDPAWVLRRLVEETKAHVLRLAFSPNRRAIVAAMAAGYRDSFRGRTGAISNSVEKFLR
ncbi:rhamnosyltransferase [Agreia bicolorata]|uniref:Rhamnosyltransferase n=1 Tax=Agreia bicolorata TaxID=110935 RepID=A0A1T4XWF1_9MICO|nr:glycosyltransferase [Agreia bicolorata]SKA93743.1 rhamnosyltransferase [Agreia bicolorata]